jgi:diaminopimelate decarboxylase
VNVSAPPPAVAAAIDALPADGPALVYDLAAVERRVRAVAAAGRASGVRVLFAMKSFPHDAVLELAAAHLDGFDAGSPGEASRLGARAGGRLVSITDPSGRAGEVPAGDLVITVESAAQAAAAPSRARLAIRLAASHLVPGPEAVGGVLEDTGRRTSRFGIRPGDDGWRDEVAAIIAAGAGRVAGFHVHHGGVAATSPARLVASARAALGLADELGLPITWLDLGGSLHGIGDGAIPALAAALAELRAVVPASVELAIEPGRLLALDAGYAVGHVVASRELAERSVRVLDLSRSCHLRWQRITPALALRQHAGAWRAMSGVLPARTGEARRVLFTGPTCYEEDVVGEWKLGKDEDGARWPEGSRLVVAGVDGYALAWNGGFGGIAPARVVAVPG